MRVRCPDTIAQPLTIGDQYDVARALTQANSTYRQCKARQDALVDAVEVRDEIMKSIQKQLNSQ